MNRLHHVVGFVRHENFNGAIKRLSSALKTQFAGPFERPDHGLRVAISLDAGIELIAPLSGDLDHPASAAFASMQEGWISVVVAVDDLDAACTRLEQLGQRLVSRRSVLADLISITDRFESFEHATFDSSAFGGLSVILAGITERDPVP